MVLGQEYIHPIPVPSQIDFKATFLPDTFKSKNLGLNDPATLKSILNRLRSLTGSYKVIHTILVLACSLSEKKTHVHIIIVVIWYHVDKTLYPFFNVFFINQVAELTGNLLGPKMAANLTVNTYSFLLINSCILKIRFITT